LCKSFRKCGNLKYAPSAVTSLELDRHFGENYDELANVLVA
jgi:hypothetical protein